MNLTSSIISDGYQTLLDLSDQRVKTWPLMYQPWYAMGVSIIYLYCVYVSLPSYMVNRKPYSLKSFIAVYNIFQVVACSLLVYGVITAGEWIKDFSFGCHPIDYSNTKIANVFWWHLIIKMVDLVETLVFILRKKTNQVSTLHVFHHVSTFWLAWLSTNFCPAKINSFVIILNSSVHVLMYSYYYLASLGEHMQAKLAFIKSKLTTVQIIQLFIITVNQWKALNCKEIPFILPYLSTMAFVINIALFFNFYAQNYLKKLK